MKRTKFSQLEMFSWETNQAINSHTTFNFNYIKNYEKVILLIFSFLLISIFSYCIGFHQGKKIAILKDRDNEFRYSQVTTLEKEVKPFSENIQQKEKTQLSIQKETKADIQIQKSKSNYTIQVATYKTAEYAKREADRLKKKGFTTMIINKGNYKLLCVGPFLDKQEAQIVLTKLKQRYEDCFIRRF